MKKARPLLLDLACGAGGASYGYFLAGFDVVGVDIEAQPNYPFDFYQLDAMELLERGIVKKYQAVHFSPPCQRFSDLAKRNGNAEEWPDFITPGKPLLEALDIPYVIENVEGSPLSGITLCGTMFPGLRVLRHRIFESNVPLVAPPHGEHPLVFTHDKRKQHYGKLDQDTSFVQVTGGGNCLIANARAAMGIDWMTKAEINEAIPPAYTKFVGRQILKAL